MITGYKIFELFNKNKKLDLSKREYDSKLMNHYVKEIISEIWVIFEKVKNSKKWVGNNLNIWENFPSGKRHYHEFIISSKKSYGIIKDSGLKEDIERVLNRWDDKLKKMDIGLYLVYKYRDGHDDIDVALKDYRTQRMNPNRYVYHCSPKDNRESIEKNGLELKKWKDSREWKGSIDLAYPPTIFATNIKEYCDQRYDIWRIDTKGLTNKWWYDLNFYPNLPTYVPIMTFEPIPAKKKREINDNEL